MTEHFGNGVVQGEWGGWYACRDCYQELYGVRVHLKLDGCIKAVTGLCPQHGTVDIPIRCNGQGTFDILFSDGKLRPVNAKWLIAA